MKKWYNSYNLSNRTGNLACPSCELQYEEEIIYSFEKRNCKNCSSDLVFHRTLGSIYIINISNSPSIFKQFYSENSQENLREIGVKWNDIKSIFDEIEFNI